MVSHTCGLWPVIRLWPAQASIMLQAGHGTHKCPITTPLWASLGLPTKCVWRPPGQQRLQVRSGSPKHSIAGSNNNTSSCPLPKDIIASSCPCPHVTLNTQHHPSASHPSPCFSTPPAHNHTRLGEPDAHCCQSQTTQSSTASLRTQSQTTQNRASRHLLQTVQGVEHTPHCGSDTGTHSTAAWLSSWDAQASTQRSSFEPISMRKYEEGCSEGGVISCVHQHLSKQANTQQTCRAMQPQPPCLPEHKNMRSSADKTQPAGEQEAEQYSPPRPPTYNNHPPMHTDTKTLKERCA